MVRVLHIVNKMGYGGIEAFLMNVYRNIDRSKIQFDFAVYTNDKGEYDDEIKELGGNIYYFSSRRTSFFKYFNDWNEFLKKNANKYSAIHMHVSSLTTILPIKLAKKYGINKRIVHAHNTHQSGKLHNMLNKINQKGIKKVSTNLFACSTEAGIYVFGKNSFKCFNNVIETGKFIYNEKIRDKIRKKFDIQEKLAFVHVGRFAYQKNHDFLIEVFKELISLNQNCKMFLIGDGELRENIEEKIKQYNLTNDVIFLGLRSDVNEILQGMDAFLFPSHHEGLPVTLIEAQASGIKIFASDTISKEVKISELIEFYSLSDTAKNWAKKILENINYVRENQYESIVKSGYDIKSITKELFEIYYGRIV